MKIVPGRADAAPRAHLPQPAEGDAFARALAERAAGFAELGMFGRAASPVPQASTPLRPAPASQTSAPDRADLPEAVSPGGAAVSRGAAKCPAANASATPVRPLLHVQPAAPARAAESQAAMQAPSLAEADAEPSTASAPRRPSPAHRHASQGGGPRLLLVEKDGRVELTAAAATAAADPAAGARLRGVLARILAGHGLLLTEFRLNGTAVRADVVKGKDGSNGPRSH